LEGIPNSINLIKKERVSKEIINQIKDSQFMLYYGYLHKRKKIEILFKALELITKKHPKILLIIAGGTLQEDYEQKLKRMATEMNLNKKAIFLGFVKEDDLNWLISQSLFVLLPASYSIAASGPLAQIIAQHKPFIASNLGVFKEEVINNEEGLLVENSVNQWVLKSKQLIEDKELIKKITLNLKKKHQQRTWSIIAGRTASFYKEVLSK
jgi:glycosyltransferase involved in cell wall biosynthesis